MVFEGNISSPPTMTVGLAKAGPTNATTPARISNLRTLDMSVLLDCIAYREVWSASGSFLVNLVMG
jgi:hypothetical protein